MWCVSHCKRYYWVLFILFFCSPAALAAGIEGATLGLMWGLPFIGILLSIAIFPIIAPYFWHHHFGKVAAFWISSFLIP